MHPPRTGLAYLEPSIGAAPAADPLSAPHGAIALFRWLPVVWARAPRVWLLILAAMGVDGLLALVPREHILVDYGLSAVGWLSRLIALGAIMAAVAATLAPEPPALNGRAILRAAGRLFWFNLKLGLIAIPVVLLFGALHLAFGGFDPAGELSLPAALTIIAGGMFATAIVPPALFAAATDEDSTLFALRESLSQVRYTPTHRLLLLALVSLAMLFAGGDLFDLSGGNKALELVLRVLSQLFSSALTVVAFAYAGLILLHGRQRAEAWASAHPPADLP